MRAKRIKNELSFHAEQLTIEPLSWRYRGNEFDNRGGIETIILTAIGKIAQIPMNLQDWQSIRSRLF